MNVMIDPFNLDVKKALVTLVIQEALIEVSKVMFELVFERLRKDYNCYVSDCYNHPEYLKDILKDFDDEFYHLIFNKIAKKLEKYSYQKQVKEFLTILSGKLIPSSTVVSHTQAHPIPTSWGS